SSWLYLVFFVKKAVNRYIRNYLVALSTYGSIALDQDYDPGNDKASLSDVEEKVESCEKSKLKHRQYDVMQRSGRVRTEADEDRFQARTAALELISDASACPVEHCTAILAPHGNPIKAPEKVINYGTQKTRGPMPTVCTTVWCTEELKYRVRGKGTRPSFSWKEEHGWCCDTCSHKLSLEEVREVRPTMPISCMNCGRQQSRRYSWAKRDTGTYFVWSRPKETHQTKLSLSPPSPLCLPGSFAGQRRPPNANKKTRSLLHVGKAGQPGLLLRGFDHANTGTTSFIHRMIKERNLDGIYFES
ncbi:hypothetical protein D6D02_10368, partial [Aureobasidium pullulans]